MLQQKMSKVEQSPEKPSENSAQRGDAIAQQKEGGWERLKRVFWTSDQVTMERSLSKMVLNTGFFTGFLVGGVLSNRYAKERFEAHAAGKSMGNAANVLRRRNDYFIIMFARNGLRAGLRMTFIMGGIAVATLATTVYRDKFSLLYFPIYSTLTLSLAILPVAGLGGAIRNVGFGFFPGVILSAFPLAASLLNGTSVDETYKIMKHNYEDRYNNTERDLAVSALMERDNYLFRFSAERRYEDLQREKAAQSEEASAQETAS